MITDVRALFSTIAKCSNIMLNPGTGKQRIALHIQILIPQIIDANASELNPRIQFLSFYYCLANTKHLDSICTTSAQRLRHCTNEESI